MDACDKATKMALEAAHNVEGWRLLLRCFEAKRYAAALLRYKDRVEEKPQGPAVYSAKVRVLEDLNQHPEAIRPGGVVQ